MAQGQRGNGDGLYVRLEIPPGASHDEVARAYRWLAHDAHPDAHPGDPDAPRRFREITEAYEVLGNPDRRERYDRAQRQARACPPPTGRPTKPPPAAFFSAPTAAGGPPVFLGTLAPAGLAPGLSIGPVQVAPSPPAVVRLGQEDAATALMARLLADILEARWSR
jgi:DnaJ domain